MSTLQRGCVCSSFARSWERGILFPKPPHWDGGDSRRQLSCREMCRLCSMMGCNPGCSTAGRDAGSGFIPPCSPCVSHFSFFSPVPRAFCASCIVQRSPARWVQPGDSVCAPCHPEECTSNPATQRPPRASSASMQELIRAQPPASPHPIPPAAPWLSARRATAKTAARCIVRVRPKHCHPRGALDAQQNWQHERDPGGGKGQTNREINPKKQ